MGTPASDVPDDVTLTLTEPELVLISDLLRRVNMDSPSIGPAYWSALLMIDNAKDVAWDHAPGEPQETIDELRREFDHQRGAGTERRAQRPQDRLDVADSVAGVSA